MNAHLALLVGYSALLVALGLWIGRFVRGAGDFFVAGRRLGAGLLFSTVLAANIGAGSTIGATSLGYRDGISAWWWNGSAGIGSLLLAFWIGPRLWREASRHNYYTVGDFLEHRYGGTVRGAITGLIWISTLWILAGQLIGGASILQVVAGLPRWAGCLISGVVMTTYFAAGGLLGSAWVNLVQLVVILAGFTVAVPFVLDSVGGWNRLVSSAGALPDGFLNLWQSSGPDAGWTLMMVLGPAFMISPGLLQKAYGASSERSVRVGIGANAIVLLLFACIPALFGIATRVNYPQLASADLALPTVLTRELPPAVGSLALAGVFSAEVSTADAVLFMLATSLSQDLYRRFINPAASETRVLAAARWAAAVGGALGVGLAIVLPTVVSALTVFYTVLGVSLFVPLIAGLHVPSVGAPEALGSIGAGVAVLLWAQAAGQTVGPLTPNALGIAAAAAAFAAVWSIRRRRQT